MLTFLEDLIRQYPLLASIISGIVSSAIFLVVLSRLKPSIEICTKIAYEDKSKKYLLKIVNKSLLFKVYDVSARLYAKKVVQTVNGQNFRIQQIKLTLSEIRSIQRLNSNHLCQDFFIGERRLNSRTDYAAVFSTSEDLRTLIEKEEAIIFEVYARHTLTGFAKIFHYDYHHSGNIVDGNFMSGNTFIIKK